MREISMSVNLTVDELLLEWPWLRPKVERVRSEKKSGLRPKPSNTLIDKSIVLTSMQRAQLLDKVASLVDENMAGRSDMCTQFAALLHLALAHIGIKSTTIAGTASYFDSKGRELFKWDHAWVRIGAEIIDGNVDSIRENPEVPEGLILAPYWGPITETPQDRKFFQGSRRPFPFDDDVRDIWWPDLQKWLSETNFAAQAGVMAEV